jgi:DNA-binding transcriptional MerR regulator
LPYTRRPSRSTLRAIMGQPSGNGNGNGGWVTTRVAAAALGVKPRQVRNYVSEGLLKAITEGEGVNRRYLVSIESVEALRSRRHSEGKLPGQYRDVAQDAAEPGHTSEDAAELLAKFAAELGEARYRLGRAEARLELTAQAESTLREQLVRERERADKAERRVEQLEARLLPPLQELRDAPETARQDAGRVEDRNETAEAQTGAREAEETARRPWWIRILGGSLP